LQGYAPHPSVAGENLNITFLGCRRQMLHYDNKCNKKFTVKPMLPVVLSENVVNLFKFYMDGSIREGMRYNDELYVLAHKFPGSHWLKGYQIACELAASEKLVAITASDDRYAIWIGLRAPAYARSPLLGKCQRQIEY